MFYVILFRKQELLNISNVPIGECPPSPPRTAPPSMKVRRARGNKTVFYVGDGQIPSTAVMLLFANIFVLPGNALFYLQLCQACIETVLNVLFLFCVS